MRPEALQQDGQLPLPSSVLEVQLRYDADTAPTLAVKQVTIKRAYVPQYDVLDSGYVLSLLSEQGAVLYALTFRIPNQVFDPPPQAGDVAHHDHAFLRHIDFALTVPMVEGAVELSVADPQGIHIIRESLRDVPVRVRPPAFESLPPGSSQGSDHEVHSAMPRWRSMLAWWEALVVETAEAATSDGQVLDVTFIGDNYTAADLSLFQQDVDRVLAHLLTYEPFASRASQLLFHRVDNTSVDLNCVHSPTMDRLITCNDATVTATVNDAGAPYDKIIVLVNDPSYGGSGGSIAVSYNGASAPQVAVHEFGHAFGGLWDEYTLYGSNGVLDGTTRANCYAGIPPAAAWEGLVALADYATGCAYPNWSRSSACSIMLSLSCPAFNAVSQRELNVKLNVYAGSLSPTLQLSASPLLIGVNGSSVLSWTSTNVTQCTASDAWSGARPVSDSETITPTATSAYTLTCSGLAGTVSQAVTVQVDAQAPTVSLTAPADGSVVSGTVTLSATATDNDAISRVEFYKDGALLGADNTVPYAMTWSTTLEATGAHTLSVQAVDLAGNRSAAAAVGVTVERLTDIQAPSVTLSNPTEGSQIFGKVRINAVAADNVGVARLELYIDGSLKASSTTGSLSTMWNVTGKSVKPGPHTLQAVGMDAAGNVGRTSITVFK